MTKRQDAIQDKLFKLADMTLDAAISPGADDQFRLDVLKQVSSLYIGHVRATKNLKADEDENVVTMESLRQRIDGGQR